MNPSTFGLTYSFIPVKRLKEAHLLSECMWIMKLSHSSLCERFIVHLRKNIYTHQDRGGFAKGQIFELICFEKSHDLQHFEQIKYQDIFLPKAPTFSVV